MCFTFLRSSDPLARATRASSLPLGSPLHPRYVQARVGARAPLVPAVAYLHLTLRPSLALWAVGQTQQQCGRTSGTCPLRKKTSGVTRAAPLGCPGWAQSTPMLLGFELVQWRVLGLWDPHCETPLQDPHCGTPPPQAVCSSQCMAQTRCCRHRAKPTVHQGRA